jgi:BirA family biotin operon repressor/biotin-[acetyl-CoA-carboxylase] ligase
VPSCLRACSYDLSRLRANLRPFRLHWSPTLRSTNDHAAALRRRGKLYAPAAVLTGRQTAGRGRGPHVWWSGPGCITDTFVLPVGEQIQPHQLPLVAGVAVRSAAAEITRNDNIQLKWPNDLLYEGRKLAGLLCERVEKADLVGLGLNVTFDGASAPAPLRDRMTSLSQIAARALDMTDVLSTVAAHLRRTIERQADRPFALLLREYDAHHALVGKTVSVLDPSDAVAVTGRCEGLDDMGRLLLRSRSQLRRIISGQVRTI